MYSLHYCQPIFHFYLLFHFTFYFARQLPFNYSPKLHQTIEGLGLKIRNYVTNITIIHFKSTNNKQLCISNSAIFINSIAIHTCPANEGVMSISYK